jgi:hypothetical protein
MKLLIFLILSFLVSCNNHHENMQQVLLMAGNNQSELQKVIDHYKGKAEKLQATEFLISNMPNKNSLDGYAVTNFDIFFTILDSFYRTNRSIANNSPYVQRVWDSLVGVYGKPATQDADVFEDYHYLKADFLIKQTDLAFTVKEEMPWGKNLSTEQFFEYVLPYRVETERMENWRGYLYNKYKTFRDTTKAKNRFEYASQINAGLKSLIRTNHTLWKYPFSMPVSILEKGHLGSCRHLVNYVTMVMRANGLPVAIDEVHRWGNHRGDHQWNVLLMEDGSFFPFNAATDTLQGISLFMYKFAKVFRNTFAKQPVQIPPHANEIPPILINAYTKDVTQEYTKTYDITVPLTYTIDTPKHVAIICTYDFKEWTPQSWGEIKEGKAWFKNMGSDVAYLVMYFDNKKLIPASDPFVLTEKGSIQYIRPSQEKQTITALRKYPLFHIPRYHMASTIGMRFQGANRADFSDSVLLGTVADTPFAFREVKVDPGRTFRYIRAISAYDKYASIAELEIYGKAGRPLQGKMIGEPLTEKEFPLQNALDKNPETYFRGKQGKYGWVGLDLGKTQPVTSLRYCPRSDVNFIVAGDIYELFYWNKDKWISLGKQTATDQQLLFTNVPKQALLILRDLSHGNEERIFTYENGQQNWW